MEVIIQTIMNYNANTYFTRFVLLDSQYYTDSMKGRIKVNTLIRPYVLFIQSKANLIYLNSDPQINRNDEPKRNLQLEIRINKCSGIICWWNPTNFGHLGEHPKTNVR